MMSKVEVLFFTADPKSADGRTLRLLLEEEMREIGKKVGRARYRRALKFDWNPAARTDDLLQALLDKRPQIVHFSGHGESEGLVLVSADGTRQVEVGTVALRQLFELFPGDIRVVVLSACFSRPQAEAIAEVVGCAIGTLGQIPDDAAITFNAAFYRAIASGYSVQAAYNQARTALAMEHSEDCACPELLVRPGLDASQLVLVSRARALAWTAIAATAVAALAAWMINNQPEPVPPRGLHLGDCTWAETPPLASDASAQTAAPSTTSGNEVGPAADLARAKEYCQAGEYDEAFPLFQIASEGGIPEATAFLGIAYQSGEGTIPNPQLAARLLRDAAYARDLRGMIAYAIAYRGGPKQGYAVNQSDYRARYWFEEAAKHGSLEGMINAGLLYLEARKDSLALDWFQRAVTAGSAEAMVEIGLMHEQRRGGLRNPAEALGWYQRAADAGSPRGMFQVARSHQNGIGVRRNYAEARRLYFSAACEGSVESMYHLGLLHLDGLGGRRDRSEGIRWIRRAAEEGSIVAEKKLVHLDADRDNVIGKVATLVTQGGSPPGCERSYG